MKNILISTGGSGGHVVPATILYQHLNIFNTYLSCDDRGVNFLDKNKYNIEIINVKKISKNILFLPAQIFFLLSSIFKSISLLKSKKIEILISTGGYMSLPLCIAAKILNLKLFLFEPNMVLGRTNRLFINTCTKILCYSNEIKKFPKKFKNKIYLIPALLRKEFYKIKATENTYKEINLLIIGGSQGAKLFDTIIKDSISSIMIS